MKIEKIHIDGFGAFHDKELTGFKSGVNVLYGKNEAGKSTMLDFIRFTLFGYPRSNADRRPPLHGGVHGGRIWLNSHGGESLMVSRKGNRQFQFDYQGNISDREMEYNRLMGNATSELYQNVYAITLDELFEVQQLSDSGMEDRIFSMGMGLAGVDFGSFEKGLIAHTENYFVTKGRTQILIEIVNQIEDKESKIAVLKQKMGEYNRLTEEQKQLENERHELNEKRHEYSRKAKQLSNFEQAYPYYVEYVAAKNTIEKFGAMQSFPKQLAEDYRNVKMEIGLLEKTITKIQADIASLKKEIQAIRIDEHLANKGQFLDYFKTTVKVYEESSVNLRNEITKIESVKSKSMEIMAQLGREFNKEDLVNLTGTFELRNKAAEILEAYNSHARNAERKEELIKQLNTSLENVGNKLKQLEDELKGVGISSSKDVQKLSEERINLDTQFQKTLSGNIQQPVGKSNFYIGLIASAGLLIAAYFIYGVNAVISILFGIGALILGVLVFKEKPKGTITETFVDGNQLNAKLKNIESILQQYERINTAQKDLNFQKSNLIEQLDIEKKELERIGQSKRNTDDAWKKILEENKLPFSLTPRVMDGFLSNVDELKRLNQDLREAVENEARLRQTNDEFENRLKEVLPNQDKFSTDLIYGLIHQLEENEKNSQLANQLSEKLAQNESVLKVNEQELEKKQQTVNDLFNKVGVQSESDFYAFFEFQEEHRKSLEKSEVASNTIQSICGHENFDNTLEELASLNPAELQIQSQQATELADQFNAEYEGKNKQLTECVTHISHILKPDEMFDLLNQRESLETKLQEETKEWLATKMALKILNESKQRFEEEKQPEVITFTRDYFKEITDNAYQDLRISLSEKHVSLIDKSGKSKTVEELSRGTREQLLLSLRMGLIAEYEKNTEPLPVVLDDVMVNFDVHRARNLVQTLTHFGEGRQVILFTCHEHTRDLFAEYNANVVNW